MLLLDADRIRKRFGGVTALEDGRLQVAAGEVHVLIGSNGCGKSTLCKIVAGAVSADQGEVRIDGAPVRFASPAAAARAGVGMFYQELSLVPQLTVAENILLGREPSQARAFVDDVVARARVDELLQRFGTAAQGISPDSIVADLAADQRQIVEILKLLARDPRIIIFDEATSSLDARQVEVFFGLIRELKREGRAIVFISHRMDEIFAIGDRVTVMRNGASVVTLDILTTHREEILAHMVGEERGTASSPATRGQSRPETLLRVHALRSDRLHDVSFELHMGEVLGLGGLHGQGQSALLRTIFGADRVHSGSVRIGDRALVVRRPVDAIRAGIAYVSGDRTRSGALPNRPIFENLVLASLAQQRAPLVDRRGFVAQVTPLLQRLKLKFPGFEAPIAELSGGNQQKVLIGRWLATAPLVLLLDDPTKGIDVGAKRDLFDLIRELAAEGVGIVLFSSEDEELLANADRVLVFNGGRISRELAGPTLNAHDLNHAAYRMDAAS
jgi:ribose transport system ATP-binding protein